MKKKSYIPYDDYNSSIPPPTKRHFIGTLKADCPRTAFRNGIKIFEFDEEKL